MNFLLRIVVLATFTFCAPVHVQLSAAAKYHHNHIITHPAQWSANGTFCAHPLPNGFDIVHTIAPQSIKQCITGPYLFYQWHSTDDVLLTVLKQQRDHFVLELWDVEQGCIYPAVEVFGINDVRSFAWSPRGDRIAFEVFERGAVRICIINTVTGDQNKPVSLGVVTDENGEVVVMPCSMLNSLVWADEHYLVVERSDGLGLTVIDTESGTRVFDKEFGCIVSNDFEALSRCLPSVVVSALTAKVMLIQEEKLTLRPSPYHQQCFAYSRDGELTAYADGNAVNILSAKTDKIIQTVEEVDLAGDVRKFGAVRHIAFSPDGNRLLVVDDNNVDCLELNVTEGLA